MSAPQAQIVNLQGFSILLVFAQDVWQVFRLQDSDAQNLFNHADQAQAQAFFDSLVKVLSPAS